MAMEMQHLMRRVEFHENPAMNSHNLFMDLKLKRRRHSEAVSEVSGGSDVLPETALSLGLTGGAPLPMGEENEGEQVALGSCSEDEQPSAALTTPAAEAQEQARQNHKDVSEGQTSLVAVDTIDEDTIEITQGDILTQSYAASHAGQRYSLPSQQPSRAQSLRAVHSPLEDVVPLVRTTTSPMMTPGYTINSHYSSQLATAQRPAKVSTLNVEYSMSWSGYPATAPHIQNPDHLHKAAAKLAKPSYSVCSPEELLKACPPYLNYAPSIPAYPPPGSYSPQHKMDPSMGAMPLNLPTRQRPPPVSGPRHTNQFPTTDKSLEEMEARKRFNAFTRQLLRDTGRGSPESSDSGTDVPLTVPHQEKPSSKPAPPPVANPANSALPNMQNMRIIPLVASLGSGNDAVTFPVLDWQQKAEMMSSPLPFFHHMRAMPGLMGPPVDLANLSPQAMPWFMEGQRAPGQTYPPTHPVHGVASHHSPPSAPKMPRLDSSLGQYPLPYSHVPLLGSSATGLRLVTSTKGSIPVHAPSPSSSHSNSTAHLISTAKPTTVFPQKAAAPITAPPIMATKALVPHTEDACSTWSPTNKPQLSLSHHGSHFGAQPKWLLPTQSSYTFSGCAPTPSTRSHALRMSTDSHSPNLTMPYSLPNPSLYNSYAQMNKWDSVGYDSDIIEKSNQELQNHLNVRKPASSYDSWTSQSESDMETEHLEQEREVCKICEDRATGLHYGILTCEGCKGFFKRTVQNKRVYRCVGKGNCPVTRMQRNRCQFCRFKKCMEKGMIIAAVREDRMPGGRNSGALYSSSKMRYKKRQPRSRSNSQLESMSSMNLAKFNANSSAYSYSQQTMQEANKRIESWLYQKKQTDTSSVCSSDSSQSSITGDNMETLSNAGSVMSVNSLNSLDSDLSPQPASQSELSAIVEALLKCESQLTMTEIDVPLVANCNMSEMLCQLGDMIVPLLVNWMRKLPFFSKIALSMYTEILTSKWQDLVLLTMVYHIGCESFKSQSRKWLEADTWFRENLDMLSAFLKTAFGHTISEGELQEQMGDVVAKVTELMATFQQMDIKLEEYVCLKVLHLFTQGPGKMAHSVSRVQERCLEVLMSCTEKHHPSNPNRLSELLILLPQVTTAASLLLKHKLVYILFLYNGTLLFDGLLHRPVKKP